MAKPKPKSLPTPGQIFAALRAAVAEPILLARLPEGDLGDEGYTPEELTAGQGDKGDVLAVNADRLDEDRGDGHWLHGWMRHIGQNRANLHSWRHHRRLGMPKNFILSPQQGAAPESYYMGHWAPGSAGPAFTVSHVTTRPEEDEYVGPTTTQVNGVTVDNAETPKPKSRTLRWGNSHHYTIPFPDHATASYFIDRAITAAQGPVAEKMLKGLKRELDKRFKPTVSPAAPEVR